MGPCVSETGVLVRKMGFKVSKMGLKPSKKAAKSSKTGFSLDILRRALGLPWMWPGVQAITEGLK